MRSLDEQTPCRGDALPIVVMTTQFPYRWIFASLESKQAFVARWGWEGGGGGTLYNGLYGKAPPESGTFNRLQVYERVGILQAEAYERVGKSVILVCKSR